MTAGRIHSIESMGLVDGPGIRTVVFLQGCRLRCRFCHNPDTWAPAGGEELSAGQLVDKIARFIPYFQRSGGGVTFSGGEPLMQWAFVREVIDRLDGIPAAIETSGYAPDKIFEEAMLRCQLILMDWKVSDPALHRRYTGVDQAPILRHAERLAQGDTPFILRLPVIPGVNDVPGHFERAAELVRGAKSLVRVDILPYQRAAGAKYGMVGMDYSPDFDEDRPPDIDTAPFERAGIPYRRFK